MPQKLEAFPEVPHASRYPWDQLLNCDVWRLERGVDFDANAKSLVGARATRASAAAAP